MKSLNEFLNEKAESKSQRRLMAVALQVREGDIDINDVEPLQFRNLVEEIVDGDMTNKQLRDFAETKESGLPENIDERATMQVKRKYAGYDSIHVGKNAPTRRNVLGFISENGSCSKEQLMDYLKSTNEENGTNTSISWIKNNSQYIVEFKNKEGQSMYKLSPLGIRVVNKTTINE